MKKWRDPNMKFWVLKRVGEVDYDQTEGFVIQAANEQAARELANRKAWEKGPWVDPKYASCTELRPAGPNRIILQANLKG